MLRLDREHERTREGLDTDSREVVRLEAVVILVREAPDVPVGVAGRTPPSTLFVVVATAVPLFLSLAASIFVSIFEIACGTR